MKDRLPALIALMILLGLLILTWWAADYAERAFPVEADIALVEEEPDAWSGVFSLLLSDEHGHLITRVDGERMRHYPHQDTYDIDDAKLINQTSDTPRLHASANQAHLFEGGERVQMVGEAHIYRYPTPERKALDIRSDVLWLYPDQDLIETDHPATVIQGNSRLQGSGMTYNNRSEQLEVYANTAVRLAPEDVDATLDKEPDTP